MEPVARAETTTPKPSGPVPPWIGYFGLAMFFPGGLAAAWSILSRESNLGLSGAVQLVLGVSLMANAYTGSVRADLLRRFEELEQRLRDAPDG